MLNYIEGWHVFVYLDLCLHYLLKLNIFNASRCLFGQLLMISRDLSGEFCLGTYKGVHFCAFALFLYLCAS